MKPDSQVHRVYATFDSLEEFKEKAIQAVAGLRRYLDDKPLPLNSRTNPTKAKPDPIPTPRPSTPSRLTSAHTNSSAAKPNSILWMTGPSPADPHPILLFEAIGGTGKSMLTWEWTTKHATKVRNDWAGRFWYSFYERGAIMADFCQRALAYITGQPLERLPEKEDTRTRRVAAPPSPSPSVAAHPRWPGARARRLPSLRRRPGCR